MTVEAYPLHWPEGWPRTKKRERSRFQTTFGLARDCLMEEIARLGGRLPILSTNVPLRRDGLPYASAKEPEDPGVSVYFEYKGKQMCFACDRFDLVKDNTQAIRKTIDAIRGIERWGASDMMRRAFSGFVALPEPGKESWRDVLGCHRGDESFVLIKARYLPLVKKHHPDNGGTPEGFDRIRRAFMEAKEELGE